MMLTIIVLDTETTTSPRYSSDGSTTIEKQTPSPFLKTNNLVSIGWMSISINQAVTMHANLLTHSGQTMESIFHQIRYTRVLNMKTANTDTWNTPLISPEVAHHHDLIATEHGSPFLFVGHGLKFDLTWLLETGILRLRHAPIGPANLAQTNPAPVTGIPESLSGDDGNIVTTFKTWDTMLVEHILLRGVRDKVGLSASCERRGLPQKEDVVSKMIKSGISPDKIDPNLLEEYNKWDVAITCALFLLQVAEFGDIGGVLTDYMELNDA